MSPREAKPPAIPIEMPRTEKDYESLISAIELHMASGNQIGNLYLSKKWTAEQALEYAAASDEQLYDTMDKIQEVREKERQAQIDAESDQVNEEG